MEVNELKKMIDHTLLNPGSTLEEFKNFCMEAVEYEFGCIAILPNMVRIAKKLLNKSGVKVCTAIGFPEGIIPIKLKMFEIKDSIENGAEELDMLVNLSEVIFQDYSFVKKEIGEFRKNTKDKTSKIIFETTNLNDKKIIRLTEIACSEGIDFIKTSTGFKGNIATTEAVRLIKKHISGHTQIKAAGGIKDLQDALKMIEAGASRLGTSNGVKIIDEFLNKEGV